MRIKTSSTLILKPRMVLSLLVFTFLISRSQSAAAQHEHGDVKSEKTQSSPAAAPQTHEQQHHDAPRAESVRTYTTSSGTQVKEYNGGKTVEESWASPNGDRNTIIRDRVNNTTTTVVDHPNGTRSVNGVEKNSGTNRNPGSAGGGGNKGGNKGGNNGNGGGRASNDSRQAGGDRH